MFAHCIVLSAKVTNRFLFNIQRLPLFSVYYIAIPGLGAENGKLIKIETWSWETYL